MDWPCGENGRRKNGEESVSGKSRRKKKPGRPKLGWLNCVEDDLKILG
jgi:hypothetical protein